MTDHRPKWLRDEPDPERRLAKEAKKAGFLRSEYLIKRIAGVTAQAHNEGWTRYQLELAIHEVEQLANEVWGQLA